MIRTTHILFSLLAVLQLSACNSLNFGGRRTVSLEEAATVLAEAEQSLIAGDHARALDGLKALLQVKGLPTLQRDRATLLFASAAEQQIKVLSASPEGAEELADIADESVDDRIAASAGIAAAQSFITLKKAEEAWKTLHRLDERFLDYNERPTAGRLLIEAGLSLSHDERNWWIFWSARTDGLACLEYVVLNHPSQPRCGEAYMRLGEMYTEDYELKLAIERYEALILYHPDNENLRRIAQARIPMLRLTLLDSPEYDRSGLLLALSELEDWMARFSTHSMGKVVNASRLDCLRRLSASDLGIARFYERIDNPDGIRLHAERARDHAKDADDADLAAAANDLLRTLTLADS